MRMMTTKADDLDRLNPAAAGVGPASIVLPPTVSVDLTVLIDDLLVVTRS